MLRENELIFLISKKQAGQDKALVSWSRELWSVVMKDRNLSTCFLYLQANGEGF